MTIPALEPPIQKAEGHQRMTECLARYVVEGRLPGWTEELVLPIARKRWQDDSSLQNLGHMARAIGYLAGDGLCRSLLEKFYDRNAAGHRGDFEALSVGYSGYQTLAAQAVMLRSPKSALAAAARGFLRVDFTISCLFANRHGRVVMPCGRVYVDPAGGWTEKGAVHPGHDFRVRAVLGISQDGWWPPRGVGPKFWQRRDGVDAWPWRERAADLAGRVFSDAERDALAGWVRSRRVAPELRSLLAPIRVLQGLHLRASADGHLGWMERIESGKGSAQVAVACLGAETWFLTDRPPVYSKEPPAGVPVSLAAPMAAIFLGPSGVTLDGEALGGSAEPVPHPRPPSSPPSPGLPKLQEIAAGLRRAAKKIRQGETAGWPAALDGWAGELEGLSQIDP